MKNVKKIISLYSQDSKVAFDRGDTFQSTYEEFFKIQNELDSSQ